MARGAVGPRRSGPLPQRPGSKRVESRSRNASDEPCQSLQPPHPLRRMAIASLQTAVCLRTGHACARVVSAAPLIAPDKGQISAYAEKKPAGAAKAWPWPAAFWEFSQSGRPSVLVGPCLRSVSDQNVLSVRQRSIWGPEAHATHDSEGTCRTPDISRSDPTQCADTDVASDKSVAATL